MTHRLTIDVPDHVYRILADITSHVKHKTIEELASEYLEVQAVFANDDPLERFCGAGRRAPDDLRTEDGVLADEAAGVRPEPVQAA